MSLLGVNIDHVATVREARRTIEPDPVQAAVICVEAGADSIVAHLREDRRHIKDTDIEEIRRRIKIRFNLEMSIAPEIVGIACRVKPDQATLVPEKREEITTEGGMDLYHDEGRLQEAIRRLQEAGILVSLFIDPDERQIKKARELKVESIELHTGQYANARDDERKKELAILADAVKLGKSLGLAVNAGHGLTYNNVVPVAGLEGVEELNIGHSIISRSVFTGIKEAVREMKELIS